MEYKKRQSRSSFATHSVDGILLPRRRYDAAVRPRPYAPLARPVAAARPKPAVTKSQPKFTAKPSVPPTAKTVRRKSRARRPLRFRTPVFAAVAFIVTAGLLIGGHGLFNQKRLSDATAKVSALKSAATAVVSATPATAPPADADPLPTLTADLQAAVQSAPNMTASATLIDLTTSRVYQTDKADKLFQAASTGKLVSVIAYLQKTEQGKASLTQKIGDVSAQTLIQQMLVNSDNAAWAKLNTVATYSQQSALLKSLSIDGVFSTAGSNTLSTNGMARLLQLLYGGKLVNNNNLAMIKTYMAQSTNTNLIPAALPSDIKVYHKYGQLGNDLHDAAVFELNGHSYALVIYTESSRGSAAASAAQVNLIHAVTKAAYADIAAS